VYRAGLDVVAKRKISDPLGNRTLLVQPLRSLYNDSYSGP